VTAADRWRSELSGWAIPEGIVAAAPESPWGYATECFRRRGESAKDAEPTPTTRRALEALPEGGTVLDVGVGGGGTSLPLAAHAGLIVGFDAQPDMLQGFLANAERAGVPARAVAGAWPEDSADADQVDVAVAGHVVYNASELEPFARALDEHARHRVVLELTREHPLAWMSDLWMHFHGLERPTGPTADDAQAALREIGFPVEREDRPVKDRPGSGGYARQEDAIHTVRKRLCLPAERDPEISEQLGDRLRLIDDLWDIGPAERTVVTLWWDRAS
jgi:SAM-dependent methyltransferase